MASNIIIAHRHANHFNDAQLCVILHGPSMRKFLKCSINSPAIAFDETSTYWSAPKNS